MKFNPGGDPKTVLRCLDAILVGLAVVTYGLILTGDYFVPVRSPLWLVGGAVLLVAGLLARLWLTVQPNRLSVGQNFKTYWTLYLLIVVALVGGFLRYQTLRNGLAPTPQATAFATEAIRVIGQSDWQPKSYTQPPLYLFVSAGLVELQFFAQVNAGQVGTPTDLKPETILAALGTLNLALSLFTLLPVYGIAARLWGSRREGLVAAGLLAASWLVYQVTPLPTPALLAAALALSGGWLAVRGWQTQQTWDWWWAGVLIGLAGAAAYGAVLLLVPLGIALIWQVKARWVWLLTGGGWLLGWTLGMPGWLLSLNQFLTGLTSIGPAPTDAAGFYARQALSGDLGLTILFGLTFVAACGLGGERLGRLWLTLAFPLLYLAALALVGPAQSGRLTLIVPFVAVGAALPIGLTADYIQRNLDAHDDRHKWAGGALAVGLTVLVALVSVIGRRFFNP